MATAEQIVLDTLTAHWRATLESTQDALHAGADCPAPALRPADLHARSRRLAMEREAVARLLAAIAREEHLVGAPRFELGTSSPPD